MRHLARDVGDLKTIGNTNIFAFLLTEYLELITVKNRLNQKF